LVDALQPALDLAQRLVQITQLQQLVRKIGVQGDVVAQAALGAGLAQGLGHAGHGLFRFPARRMAAGQGVQVDGELLVTQGAQGLVAQGVQQVGRALHLTLAPQRARQAGHGQQLGVAFLQLNEAAARGAQLRRCGGGAGKRQTVKTAHQLRPGLAQVVLAVFGPCLCLLNQRVGRAGIGVQHAPGLLGQAHGGAGGQLAVGGPGVQGRVQRHGGAR